MSTSWLIRLLSMPTRRGSVTVKELFASPSTDGRIQHRTTSSAQSRTQSRHPRCRPSASHSTETRPAPVVVSNMVKLIAGYSRTALDVEQRRIPRRPTDLAREKADAVSLHAGRERRVEQADARVAEVGPIALCFQSEHKLIGLPAIPDLPAEQASGTIATAVAEHLARRHVTKLQQLWLSPQPPLAPM